MVHADCAFRMGKSHQVCQDYAVAGAGEFPYVLLADGCSSSPDTDIGARLLVRSALSGIACLMNEFGQDVLTESTDQRQESCFRDVLERYHRDAMTMARQHGDVLGLLDTALDATLLTVAAQKDHWFASVFGDGVIAAKNRNGGLEVTVVSYPGGYPFYPNYLLDAGRKRALLRLENSGRNVERFVLMPDGSAEKPYCDTCPADFACQAVIGKCAEYAWVAVLSDGVHSFYEAADCGRKEEGTLRGNSPILLSVVLHDLLAFKTMKGQFVQRRLQRFLRDCDRRGWQHYDDLSVAVLCFED